MNAMARHYRTGTVYERGGVWWLAYFVRGRRVRESSGFTVKADAENLLRQRVGDVAAGRRVGPEKATIGDLCALVLEDYQLRKLRDYKHTEWRYLAHVKPALGNLPAGRFGPAQIKVYIAHRRAEGASDTTINREMSIIRRGFTLGAQQDPPLVFRQPSMPKLEEDNARQGFLEQEQYEKLLEEMPGSLKAMLVVGYHTGARKGELRKVRWEQVDFEGAVIRLSVAQTKGKKARTLPIYGDMERWLKHQRETCPDGCPWVFHGRLNRPVDSHLNGWTDARKRAGLDDLLFHDLRRSAVRNMTRAGIPDTIAMSISGHKTRAVFDRYNIVSEADVQSAAGKLEQYAEKRKIERAAPLQRVK
jgi:integrase